MKFLMLFVFITVLEYSVKCNNYLEIDDICPLNENGTMGKCKLISECPHAQKQLQQYKIRPIGCGFHHKIPIVCCEKIDIPTVPTIIDKSDENIDYIPTKSVEKCSEYANLVYKNQSSPILLPGIFWEIANTCDYDDNRKPTVTDKEFPHMVSIGYKMRSRFSSEELVYKCTGALISEEYILTTATCTNLTDYGLPKVVRLGTTIQQDNYFEYPEVQILNVQEFIRHPRFNVYSKLNDIALIKLAKKPILNSFTRPACISGKMNQSKHVTVAGYSSINTGNPRSTLKKTFLTIDSKCTNTRDSFIDVDLNSCMRNLDCVLDLGAPLVVYNENPYCTYSIVGLLSYVEKCNQRYTGFITDVSKYINWIEENIWA